jgi:hypothetical protein
MAILNGFNQSHSYKTCDPTQIGQLDTCPFVWKDFHDSGYVTGYAEDEAKIGTFNYHKLGFLNQPTTHYFRPFSIAAEKYLKTKCKSSLKFCLGFQNYADFIYKYALDFATAYKDDPFFGLFWSNTFSHNDISDPSSMDGRIKYYLEELDSRGILNTSAVVFFSDHGMRFGRVRQLLVRASNFLSRPCQTLFVHRLAGSRSVSHSSSSGCPSGSNPSTPKLYRV